MDTSCLEYRLTDAERRTFEETGMLVVENALSPEQVRSLTETTDAVYARHVAQGHDSKTALFYPNFIPDDAQYLSLVDHPKILPKVWGILGWNIYLYHGHLIVTPPTGQTPDDKTFGWHQDSGRVNQEMEIHPAPPAFPESRLLPFGYEGAGPGQLLGHPRQPPLRTIRLERPPDGQWAAEGRDSRAGEAGHGRLLRPASYGTRQARTGRT